MILQRLLPGARGGGTDGATMMATMITAMMLAAMLTVMVMKCSYAAGGSRRAPHAPRHAHPTPRDQGGKTSDAATGHSPRRRMWRARGLRPSLATHAIDSKNIGGADIHELRARGGAIGAAAIFE